MKDQLAKTKINLTIVSAIFVLLILGCQSSGGELLPLGGEGIEISTSRFENDTAVINDNGLIIKLYGDWDGRANVRVIFENNSGKEATINFEESKISDSQGENIPIDSVAEDDGTAVKTLNEKSFKMAADKKRKFLIGFPLNLSSSLAAEPERIITVSLAVKPDSTMNELRQYKFEFKGIPDKDLSGKADPEDW